MLNVKKMSFALLLIAVAVVTYTKADLQQDCETIRARCGYCVRSLYAGDEDNLIGRLNLNCQKKVGLRYVWRPVDRCQMVYLRCMTLNATLNCDVIAERTQMTLRLP